MWTHPGFAHFRFGDDDGHTNDVAVLKLAGRIEDRPTVPVVGQDEVQPYRPGTMARFLGWGYTAEGVPGQRRLHTAEVPIVSGASGYGPAFDARTMVCAGYVDGGMDMDRDADDLHGWRGSCGGPARRRRGTIAYLIRGYTSHSDVVLDLDGHPAVTEGARYLHRIPVLRDATDMTDSQLVQEVKQALGEIHNSSDVLLAIALHSVCRRSQVRRSDVRNQILPAQCTRCAPGPRPGCTSQRGDHQMLARSSWY